MKVDAAITLLSQRRNTLRKSELIDVLQSLGFSVRRGSNGNHHTYLHTGLAPERFYGASFDGGHGADAQLRACYVDTARRVLSTYREALNALLGEHDA